MGLLLNLLSVNPIVSVIALLDEPRFSSVLDPWGIHLETRQVERDLFLEDLVLGVVLVDKDDSCAML